jgi:hypothetical protein
MPGGYVMRDADGQALAYIYSWDNVTEAPQAKMLRRDGSPSTSLNCPSYWGRLIAIEISAFRAGAGLPAGSVR